MKRLFAVALALLPAAASADYLGVLKPPPATQPGAFSLHASTPPAGPLALTGAENGQRLKLGYKASRHFAIEGEFADWTRASDPFANPATPTSAFRGTSYALDTVASLPWRGFSFYGRMGAYRGDRGGFASATSTLLNDPASRGMRWRYGLGLRYDFTPALGVRAELERYSDRMGAPFAGDVETDQLSVGLSWRF